MKENFSKWILLLLATTHLLLVTLSASYIEIPEWVPGHDGIDFYLRASGADSSYGFFAPSIGVKVRALFDIVTKSGETIENIALIPPTHREAEIRLGGIFEEFTSKDADDKQFRHPLAASLAAAVFTRHADASYVLLHVQEYWPKTMDEFRNGERSAWSDYYSARLSRKGAQ